MFPLAAQAAHRNRETQARDCLVFMRLILPRWFSNQWFTDSLLAHTHFYFL